MQSQNKKKFKKDKKINRTNNVVCDAAQTAGVEYDEELFDEHQEDPDYESDD